jgi:hypothetical protein
VTTESNGSSGDPRLNDLVATLRRLEEALQLAREELVRQGERTRVNGEGVTELRGNAVTRHYVAAAAENAVHAALVPIRSDVDKLMSVIKPGGRTGLAEEHEKDHKVLSRWVYGVGGVMGLIGLLVLVSKLPGLVTWLQGLF